MKSCSKDGCHRPHLARGFCSSHDQTARRLGEIQLLPKGHVLENIDKRAMLADCSLCGPGVPILSRANHVTCALRVRAKAREDYKANAEKRREYHRKYNRAVKFGFTPDELAALLKNALCAICETPLSEVTARLDHDHRCCAAGGGCPRCFRGFLCSSCNTGIGQLGDDPARLQRAAQYLQDARRSFFAGRSAGPRPAGRGRP